MNIFLLSRVMQTNTQMKTLLRFHIRYAVIQPRHKHSKKRTRIWVSKKRNFPDIDKWTILTYWMQKETQLFFVRPTHATKRKRARIRFSIEKKQSNYYVDAAIVSTKTREQVGTDEN